MGAATLAPWNLPLLNHACHLVARNYIRTLAEKAAALGFSLIKNHPFVDGNKRIGHAATELFLFLNGQEIVAPVGEQEKTILEVASGEIKREEFVAWLQNHIRPV
jgi:death-on-curing protein